MTIINETKPSFKWYRIKTVADAFDVNPQTIENMIKKGIFHPIKFGGATVISHDDLFAYLESNKTNYEKNKQKNRNV